MSVRAEVLTAFEAKLKSIKRGREYKTDVKTVTTLAASDHDLDQFTTPAIYIIDDDDDDVKDIGTNRVDDIKINLKGYLIKESNLRETFEKFLGDVKKCLFKIESVGELHDNVQFVKSGGTAILRGQCCMGFELEVTIRYHYPKANP